MIGWYVHHHGAGHRHRASAVVDLLGDLAVTGLSTGPRPDGWRHDWLVLPADDAEPAHDPTARGALHWAPEGHPGQRDRMAVISDWIGRTRPSLLVVDVSVEVALLARLHGVPVVVVVLPGRRDDAPHRLAHRVARRVVAAWPATAPVTIADGTEGLGDRLVHVGALSRFDGRATSAAAPRRATPHVVVLAGAGGGSPLGGDALARARRQAPRWRWTVLDAAAGTWSNDPWPLLRDADVVVTHAGQNALAEVAAAGVPAVVVPQDRPFDEQRSSAAALVAGGYPVTVVEDPGAVDWATVLDDARIRPIAAWTAWNDGRGAHRLAALVRQEAACPA